MRDVFELCNRIFVADNLFTSFFRYQDMNLDEIEKCLEKYAFDLNRIGGTIYTIADDHYNIATKSEFYSYSKVAVDGADLVLRGKDYNDDTITETIRIPYHSISYIEIMNLNS